MSEDSAGVGFVVPTELAGQRVDRVLAELMGVSRGRAAARIDAGDVTLEGAEVRRSSRVEAGVVLVVNEAPEVSSAPVDAPALPPIRWQDDHLAVVAKPAGLVVHAGAGHQGDTLVDALLAAGVALAADAEQPERPGIVHRLDRDTSGLLVVAKTEVARQGLGEALRRRDVTRRYLALAQGTLPSIRGRIDAPLGRHPADRKRFAVVAGGREAVTHWEVAAAGAAEGTTVSLVACRLETGRTHQIRVHLAGASCPVVGDLTYGASQATMAALGLRRLFLHAALLAFEHPVSGERIEVVEPLPSDLRLAAERAGVEIPAWAEVSGSDAA